MEKTVLIVDDDAGFRRVARQLLEHRGYKVIGCAAGVEEARERASTLDPDVILMDVSLPDGNGVELAAELGGGRGGRPVTLLTSSDPHAVPGHVLAGNAACGFLAKTELAQADLDGYLRGDA